MAGCKTSENHCHNHEGIIHSIGVMHHLHVFRFISSYGRDLVWNFNGESSNLSMIGHDCIRVSSVECLKLLKLPQSFYHRSFSATGMLAAVFVVVVVSFPLATILVLIGF